MSEFIVHGLAWGIIAGALFLAARYPRVFGFFAWEFGVTPQLGERAHSFHLRAFRYWTSVCTLGALMLALAWLEMDMPAHPYMEGFFYFLAPIVLGVGYLQAAINLAQYAWYRRLDARRPPPPPHRPLF